MKRSFIIKATFNSFALLEQHCFCSVVTFKKVLRNKISKYEQIGCLGVYPFKS